MKTSISVCLFSVLVLFLYNNVNAQFHQIDEDDLDFTVLKWHYDLYPKTVSVWEVLNIDGVESYRAKFNFKGYPVSAIYNSNGKLISEETDLTRNVPVSLVHYLDESFDKYKVLSFVRITDAESESVSFELEIKSKQKGVQIIVLEENLIPLDSISN